MVGSTSRWTALAAVASLSVASAFTSSSSFAHGRRAALRRPRAARKAATVIGMRRGDFDDRDSFNDFDDERRQPPRGNGKRNIEEVVGGSGGLSTLIPQTITQYLLAGIFVLGVGTGVTVDSAINTNPKDLASRDAVDQAAPNKELCLQYGSSAMVMDQRLFVTFNPFNVYVTQADTKPGCVLRQSNVVSVLEDRRLLEKNEVAACKNNMNTWAFVGDLEDRPQLSCVYKSQDAQNEFLSDPRLGLGEDVYDNDLAKAEKVSNAKKVKQ